MSMKLTKFTRMFRIVGLVTILMLVGCGDVPESEAPEVIRPVKLMTIGAAPGGETVEYPGALSAIESVRLGFEVPGKIIELPISNGMRVQKGQLLARLDDTDYVAARNGAQANHTAALAADQRAKRIFKQGAGSQAEVDRALRNLHVAKSELKQAKKALSDTILKAPFSGIVAIKLFDNFKNVQAKEPVLLFQDISRLKLNVNVPEQDIAAIKTGLAMEQHMKLLSPEIAVSAVPGRTFPARMTELETAADEVTRTYHATFVFTRPKDVNILPGMTARVILYVKNSMLEKAESKGVMIPAVAVVSGSDGTPYVWRFNPESGKVSRIKIVLGRMSGDKVEVLEGLNSGNRIAIAGAAHLREGMKVRPLDEQAEYR